MSTEMFIMEHRSVNSAVFNGLHFMMAFLMMYWVMPQAKITTTVTKKKRAGF